MASEITSIYKQDLLPRLDYKTVLAPLNPRLKSDNYYVICPLCGEPEAFIKIGRDRIQCNRANNCGGIDLITWINGGKTPDNKRWCELVRELAKQHGMQIPEISLSDEALKIRHKQKQAQDVWEAVLKICHQDLHDSPASQYLNGRGFDDLANVEMGYFIRSHVNAVATRQQQEELGFHSFEKDGQTVDPWHGRLIIPIRNRFGEVAAISGRDLTGESRRKFYKTHGYKPEALPVEGLDVAAKLRHIWLGESTIAIQSFRYHGLNDMTGIGGSNTMSAERWEKLAAIGIESVTLMLDPDEAGAKGEGKAIKEWFLAKHRPDLYVVDSKLWEGKDPDEYLRAYGAAATKAIVGKAVNAHEFLAMAWARELDPKTPKGLDAYIDRTAKHLASIADSRMALQAWEHFFKRGVQVHANFDEDFYFDYVSELKRQRESEKTQSVLREVQQQLAEAVQTGQPATARPLIAGALHKVDSLLSKKTLRPAVPVANRLNDYEDSLAATSGKESLGLCSHVMPTLEYATLGRRLMTCVAGGPGTGKTTLVIGDALDVLAENEKCALLVVSLEMRENELLDRIYSRLLKVPYDELKLKSTPELREKARELVTPLAGRIMIIDTDVYPQITADDILREVANLKQESGCDEIYVVLDYFQIFPIPDDVLRTYRTTDERDEWKAKELKRVRDSVYPNPFTVISEVNKADGLKATSMASVRGSARLPYVSDNVWLINRIEESELLERVGLMGQSFHLKSRRRKYGKKQKLTDDERAQGTDLLLDEMERQGVDFLDIELPKVRGGRRKAFVIQHNHTISDMRELSEHGPIVDARPGTRKKATA